MTDYSELLTKQDKKTLVNLLANFSEKYPEIENEMCAKLGVLDEKKKLKKSSKFYDKPYGRIHIEDLSIAIVAI